MMPFTSFPVQYQALRLRVEPADSTGERISLNRPELVAAFCRDMIHLPQEMMLWLGLDCRKQLVALDELYKGTVDMCIAHPRDVFRNALVLAPTVESVILVHNHPSGEPRPSEEDREFFAAVIDAGRLLRIPVVDCLVVAESGYWSHVDGLHRVPEAYEREAAEQLAAIAAEEV
jgi:DNA repair protein RadC